MSGWCFGIMDRGGDGDVGLSRRFIHRGTEDDDASPSTTVGVVVGFVFWNEEEEGSLVIMERGEGRVAITRIMDTYRDKEDGGTTIKYYQ